MKTFEKAFIDARISTVKTVSHAAGWNVNRIDAQLVDADSQFFYVKDMDTNWIWCCSIPDDSFQQLVDFYATQDHDVSVAFTQGLIAECVMTGQISADQENSLAAGLSAYISKTQTYALSRGTDRRHFGVIRYEPDLLRPFVLAGYKRYLNQFNEMKSAFENVVRIDQTNHPEWFKK